MDEPFCNKNKICQSMNDNSPDILLDDAWQYGKRGWQTLIGSITSIEYRVYRTCHPIHIQRSMNRLFNVSSIEVDWSLYIRGLRAVKKKLPL